jgi:hypothetical protein
MTLTITDTTITSDQNPHTAGLAQDQVAVLISPTRARATTSAAASLNRDPEMEIS